MKTVILLSALIFTWTESICQEINRWPIQKCNWKLGFIDSLGNEIYKDNFKYLSENYNSGLVFFQKNNVSGFLDKNGKEVFNIKISWGTFSEGLLKVDDSNKFFYLNTKGEIAIDLKKLELPKGKEISSISDFKNGLALIRIQNIGLEYYKNNGSDISFEEDANLYPGNWYFGFINKSGQWAIPPNLETATSFNDGISKVWKDGKTSFIDTTGKIITNLDYFSIRQYSEGFAIVQDEKNKSFFIDKYGKRITKIDFDKVSEFSDSMAAIQLNDKWGFIDTTGIVVIEPKYYITSKFSEGLAPVSLRYEVNGNIIRGRFIEGFIDKKGNIIIPFEKDVSYKGFNNGLTQGSRFIYTKDNKYTGTYELFYMKKNGKKIWSEIVRQNR